MPPGCVREGGPRRSSSGRSEKPALKTARAALGAPVAALAAVRHPTEHAGHNQAGQEYQEEQCHRHAHRVRPGIEADQWQTCHSPSTFCHDRGNVRHMTGRRRARTDRRTIVNVAVLALNEVAAFELGVICEVFGTDRTDDGFPAYDFKICTPDGQPVLTRSGFSLIPNADLAPLAEADLVAVPAHPID